MKTIYVAILQLIFFSFVLSAQQAPEKNGMLMLGDPAPSFSAQSTKGTINFPGDYLGKWKILFSHPADFTPVCSTEILELADMQDEFRKLNTQLLVLSTDGLNSHIEWVQSLENIQKNEGEDVGIDFPLVPDIGLEISRKYGMIHSNMSMTKTVRGVFIISPEDTICAMFFYPFSTGRNLEEIKRTLIALQESDRRDVLTPANWQPGDDFLISSPETKEEAEKMARKDDPSLYSKDWYLWYKKSK